jgi:hypothetical protein
MEGQLLGCGVDGRNQHLGNAQELGEERHLGHGELGNELGKLLVIMQRQDKIGPRTERWSPAILCALGLPGHQDSRTGRGNVFSMTLPSKDTNALRAPE